MRRVTAGPIAISDVHFIHTSRRRVNSKLDIAVGIIDLSNVFSCGCIAALINGRSVNHGFFRLYSFTVWFRRGKLDIVQFRITCRSFGETYRIAASIQCNPGGDGTHIARG
ncbi:hypothetical protein D3C77_588720 [compost metagenome]